MTEDTKPFYIRDEEDSIDNKGVTELLQATPYSRDPKINFSNRITKEFFFHNFYAYMWQPEHSKSIKKKNADFDRRVRDSLLEMKNMDSKADFIHIWGYAGCGKTTYVHRLLWELGIEDKIEYTIVDFELTKTVVQALKDTLYNIFNQNVIGLYDFLYESTYGNFFVIDAFGKESRALLYGLVKKLGARINKETNTLYVNPAELSTILDNLYEATIKESAVEPILEIEYFNPTNPYTNFIDFLITVIFLYNLYELLQGGVCDNNKSNIILFDNVDSLDNRIEEYAMLNSMTEFRTKCIMFFNQNHINENTFGKVVAKDFLDKIKFSFFMTSRVVTVRQLLSIRPDLESYIGKPNHEMPEYFYSHEEIFDNKIKYYNEVEQDHDSRVLQKLNNLDDFRKMIYRATSFRKLFNGNIRYCFATIENLYERYRDMPFVKDCERLNKEAGRIHEAGDGANGIVLAMLADYMKENSIFKNKLHLSICRQDNEISLSRIVLTIIHEYGGSCSLLDVFNSLPPKYCNAELCNMIYDLNETDREYWRRLIIFEKMIPRNKIDLQDQLHQFLEDKKDSQNYSRLKLCRSGDAYLSSVITHFEFMLCRCNYPGGNLEKSNYTPLFSSQSLNKVQVSDNKKEVDYAFTLKIRRVYDTVSACLLNSKSFSDEVMKHFGYDQEYFLHNSFLNYHDDDVDTPIAKNHQSYIGRLIFVHVGYIERYRQYLIQKGIINVDINEKLTKFISDYLELYGNAESFVHSDAQDEAYIIMTDRVKTIVDSGYNDYKTVIKSEIKI